MTEQITSRADLEALLRKLESIPVVAVDTETYDRTGKDNPLVVHRAGLSLLTLAWGDTPDERAAVVARDVYQHSSGRGSELSSPEILDVMSPFFRDSGVRKVFHNAFYDINVLLNYEVVVNNYDCTMTAAWCRDENGSHGLKELSVKLGLLLRKYTNASKSKDPEAFVRYAAEDAWATWKLHRALLEDEESPLYLSGIRRKFYLDQELPLIDLAIQMSRYGIKIDRPKLEAMAALVEKRMDELAGALFKLNGGPINLDANAQVANLLFKKLKLPVLFRTEKTRAPAVDKTALYYIAAMHPAARMITEYNELGTLYTRYVGPDGLLWYVDGEDVLHPSLNFVGTITGRPSASQPNLLNIPREPSMKGAKAKYKTAQVDPTWFGFTVAFPNGDIRPFFSVRRFFLARDGKGLVDADWSQIEMRLIGVFSNDRNLTAAYLNHEDLHSKTALMVHVDRDTAKAHNFGDNYEMGAATGARMLTLAGSPTSEAQMREDQVRFFSPAAYGGVAVWRDNWTAKHKREGQVSLITGRPRRVPDLGKAGWKGQSARRTLINNTIQGSVGDLMKQAMLRASRMPEYRDLGGRMQLQIYDELLAEFPKENAEEGARLTEKLMAELPENLTIPITIPIEVSAGIGANWAEAKK